MPDQPPYLIEKVLPSGRVHLLAGISNVGKSRWMLPTLALWQTGAPVLGLRSYPVPWCLVCSDRPLADAHDALKSMGFRPSDVDIIPAFGKHDKNYLGVVNEVVKNHSKVQFIFWEGFDLMVPNPNCPNHVRRLISSLTGFCESGLTVVGSVGVPKLKPRESYENPRQLVGGSTIWERTTSTNFVIQPTNPRNIADPSRILHVSLKDAPSFNVQGSFDHNGVLVFESWDHSLEDQELKKLLNDAKDRKHNR